MIDNIKLEDLHTNQRLLVLELIKRGVKVDIIDQGIELLRVSLNNHREFLLDRYSSICPYPVTKISSDKYLIKKLLKENDMQITEGEVFNSGDIKKAVLYARNLGFPLVCKPNWGSHGDFVYTDIRSVPELENSIRELTSSMGKEMPFLVEKYFSGKEYRIFITKNGEFAVSYRDPAHVVGDGLHTILQLADIETRRRRIKPPKTCLCPIVIDSITENFLKRRGIDIFYVPQLNEKAYLRSTSNVTKGGTCTDFTDKIHPSVITIAKKALQTFEGLPYAGIDLITYDISKEQTSDSYRILEINSNPGFSLHMLPGKGKPRNVAKYVADLIFPETS